MTALLAGIIVILLIYIILQSKRTHSQHHPVDIQDSLKPVPEEPLPEPLTEDKPEKNNREDARLAKPTEQPNELQITAEFKNIRNLLVEEKTNLLLVTGGAGTGKTTLIQWLHKEIPNSAICAFTGMAALNSKGSTIHSLFHLPPMTFLPQALHQTVKQLNSSSRNILDHLNLLIIDEISMVRADLLDAIDYSLRINRETNLPFGGVQLLMVGDPYQLPPIVTKNELIYFSPSRESEKYQKWNTPWFFSAHVFKDQKIPHMELTHIFRQNEDEAEYKKT